MKNIDKIRQMTADELAEFIFGCEYCIYDASLDDCLSHGKCIKGHKQWLEQEVEE